MLAQCFHNHLPNGPYSNNSILRSKFQLILQKTCSTGTESYPSGLYTSDGIVRKSYTKVWVLEKQQSGS